MNGSKWSRSEQNALELLYRAEWRWAAIAAHVSGIHGKERSPIACQRKATALGMVDADRLHWRRLSGHYDADLTDMMVLDYPTSQMAAELTRQYGQRFTQPWVHKRLVEIGGNRYAAWQQRAGERQSRGNEKGWIKRRRAAA